MSGAEKTHVGNCSKLKEMSTSYEDNTHPAFQEKAKSVKDKTADKAILVKKANKISQKIQTIGGMKSFSN